MSFSKLCKPEEWAGGKFYEKDNRTCSKPAVVWLEWDEGPQRSFCAEHLKTYKDYWQPFLANNCRILSKAEVKMRWALE